MSLTFIQHLLENEATSKENLLEVNSEDFLNILLAAAGEEPLQEGELEGFPKHMTVGELINIYEGRMPPPRMNYNFDEVDPGVDAKSFSRAGAARRKAEHSPDYNREMGFRDAENERTRSGRFRGMDAEESMEHQMMHGTEEEEAKAKADDEVFNMVSNRSQRLSKANKKRYDQNIRRMRRSYVGKQDERGNYDS